MTVPVNTHRGEAELNIGGKDRLLCVDFNTIAAIENGANVSIILGAEDLERSLMRVDFIRVGVAAALSTDRRKVSPDVVGRWFSEEPGKLIEAASALSVALQRFFVLLTPKKTDPRPTTETAEASQADVSTGQG